MRALVAAFAFLTRLPVWAGPLRDNDLGRAVTFFPMVGLVLGLVLTGLASLLVGVLVPELTAVVLVAFLAAMTGGLHLDGFADVFDGLGGGRGDRKRMLEIMRDSHIGAHGAAALVLLLLAKVLAIGHVLERHDLLTLLAFPAIGRWAVTPAIVLLPYARAEGLGRAFNGEARPIQIVGSTAILGLMILALGSRLLLPAASALVLVMLFSLWMRRRLGGLTGDVYGAAIELGEVTMLAVAGALP
jgi:adenosylcobinamide-GDP ribazoletransferase